MKLTKEEQDILESVERGEWRSVPNLKEESRRYQEAARRTMSKAKKKPS